MNKLTLRQAVCDLADQFLCEIVKKKMWREDEIVSEFQRAMYCLSLEYFDRIDSSGTIREMNLEVDRLLIENEKLKETARELSLKLAAIESGDDHK